MSDLIDRREAVELAMKYCPDDDGAVQCEGDIRELLDELENLPSVQPDHNADIGKKVEQTGETAQNVQNEDLISRKWLVECIEEGWVKFDTAKDCNRMMHLVRDIAPSVQPEIIRCKDCKHWRFDHTCREHSLVSPMMANEFCSRAERREGWLI